MGKNIFMVCVNTEDAYADIAKDVETKFYTLIYRVKNHFLKGKK